MTEPKVELEILQAASPSKETLLVKVRVIFDGPFETLEMTVCVPNRGTDEEKKSHALGRGQTLARSFGNRS